MEENTNANISTMENEEVANSSNEVKTYTEDEVMKLIASETDRRVSQALKTNDKKWQKQLSLANLDENEKAKAERDNRIAELEEQLAAYAIEKNRSEIKSVLSSRGLSAEFADLIQITDDIEASQSNISKFDRLFKAAVKAEVEKRLAGSAPKGNDVSGDKLTKEKFMKLSFADQARLLQTNPELEKFLG